MKLKPDLTEKQLEVASSGEVDRGLQGVDSTALDDLAKKCQGIREAFKAPLEIIENISLMVTTISTKIACTLFRKRLS